MKRSETARQQRGIGFESFEDRFALSGDPLANYFHARFHDHAVEMLASLSQQATEGHGWNEVAYAREQFGLQGARQTVAVIDSGIAYDHMALGGGFGAANRVVGGWDFAENDADPYDDGPAGFHGTHVAGIIGSSDAKYAGVAKDVDLVALRVFDDQGGGQLSWVESALRWVHDHRNSFEHAITTVNLSLGTDWNSPSSLPNWASLEDEFRQLESDGIFISVAAGNSFRIYQSVGLSYPAVSPYVVPVASVAANGSLSGFSQRSERVLAAPGEKIMSTVPDAFFGGDGYKNDWGAASGTSMAAPYVAGASVLMREAMQSLGYVGITQDQIYDRLFQSADLVWDAVTQANYHRVNLQRALDSLIGADDFGSGVADAHALGTLSANTNFAGVIGRLADKDVFRFTAAANGTVTFTASATSGDLAIAWQNVPGAKINGNQIVLEVAAGQTYTVGLGTAAGIGKYSVEVQVVQAQPARPAPIDWGSVEFAQPSEVRVGGEAWFQIQASRTGILTVEALLNQAGGNVDLEIYDAHYRLIGASKTAGNERIDLNAAQGSVYFVRAVGANADVDFRLTNLVTVGGKVVDIAGTAGGDAFRWTGGSQHQIAVNGVQYAFSGVTTIRFHGGGGGDSLVLTGSSAAETAVLRGGNVELTASAYQVSGTSIEANYVLGGVEDAAYLYDSVGRDLLEANSRWTRLAGNGFSSYVAGMSSITVYSWGGGDQARLVGSAGDDVFTVSGGSRIVRGSGFELRCENFQSVQFEGGGGRDRAELLDLVSSDEFYGHRNYGRLTAAQYKTELSNVDDVLAKSRAGERNRNDIRTVDYVFQTIGS